MARGRGVGKAVTFLSGFLMGPGASFAWLRAELHPESPQERESVDSTCRGTQAGVCNVFFCALCSSCCFCWPDVLVCEAEVLRGLPGGENAEVRLCRALHKTQGASAAPTQNHRTTGWLRLAGPPGGPWCHPCPSRGTQSRLPRTMSRQLLKISKEGD